MRVETRFGVVIERGSHPTTLRARAAIALALGAGLSFGCRPGDATISSWHRETGYQWRDLQVKQRSREGFTVVRPKSSGIVFANHISDSLASANRMATHGGGVALGDVDGDGWIDIFLARGEGPNSLYRNQGGFGFEDIAVTAGVAAADQSTTGAIFADADGDRDLDLFLTTLAGPNTLYLNDGKGGFTPSTDYPGQTSKYGSVTGTLADVDGDGDLDVYVATHKAYTASDRYIEELRANPHIARPTPDGKIEVREQWRNDYRVRITSAGPRVEEIGEPDLFYLNQGNGKFVQEPLAMNARFQDYQGQQLTEEPPYFGLAARFYDINGDRAPDLYVANDFQHPDQFWINDGTGRFRHVGDDNLIHVSHATMAVDFADINRDGLPDLFEVDMLSRDPRLLRRQLPSQTGDLTVVGSVGLHKQYARNSLFLNRGDGTFAQIAELADVDASGWSWGTLFLDVDLDGYEDLLIATGNRWDEIDGAIANRLSGDTKATRIQDDGSPPLLVPNYAFRNRGDLTFEEVGDRWGFNTGPDISHGIALGDLDRDGDLDVVVNRLNQTAVVLRNDTPAPRLSVRLAGTVNTSGVGAKVRVLGGPAPIQEREMTAGGLYLSHSDYSLTFATGQSTSLTIEVEWQSGKRSVITNAVPNREYLIEEGGATSIPNPPADTTTTWFADQSISLGHTHQDPPFPGETLRQPLVPYSLAELGPGVTIGDLDRDGDDDLVIGTGRGGSVAWYRNDRGRFTAIPLGLTASGDLTTILPWPRSDGTLGLLLGQSSYESLDEAHLMPSVLAIRSVTAHRGARGVDSAVGPTLGSIGHLSQADFDSDGDLDLFVAERLIPGEYPRSAGSHLYRNRGDGLFDLDSENDPLFADIGMVSAAVATDIDNDGDPDLALAVDWGPIRLFLNQRGRFQAADSAWGLAPFTSRWIGIASGDFDRDGRPDLVTTSYGRNLRNRPDSTRPLTMYFGQFDQNATFDVVLAQRDSALGGLAPITSFLQLIRAIPSISERVDGIASFAEITVDSILGGARRSAKIVEARTLDHTVWFNRGSRFERRSLPIEAQLAPSFAPVVADFDGDGYDDIFLSQNYSGTGRESPPLNDGRGILLRGLTGGAFEAIPGDQSGITVYGDQRGAATGDFDRDGRPDLVVSQNNKPTRLFRNATGVPGLRVRLTGPAANPHAIGASLRLTCGGQAGPFREVQAGTGYWSVNSPTQVLAFPAARPCTLVIGWPNGERTTVEIPEGEFEKTVAWPGTQAGAGSGR